MAILEALAAGLPIVTTRVGASPELIEEGVNGYLVAPGDVDALRQQMERLIRDPALRWKMGENNRRKCAEHFLADRVVLQLEQLLSDCG